MYLIGGVGNTKFNRESKQTYNFGFGARVFFYDWMGVQLDAREHLFTTDILGRRDNTHNLELTLGVTFFF